MNTVDFEAETHPTSHKSAAKPKTIPLENGDLELPVGCRAPPLW